MAGMIMSLFDAVSLITIVATYGRLHIKAEILGFSNHGIQTPVTESQRSHQAGICRSHQHDA